MTHRIEVNVETGKVIQVEYTLEEQATHDAAVAAQALAEAQQAANAAAQAATTEKAP